MFIWSIFRAFEIFSLPWTNDKSETMPIIWHRNILCLQFSLSSTIDENLLMDKNLSSLEDILQYILSLSWYILNTSLVCVCSWEFVTDDYDIGFGIFLKPTEKKAVKVHAGEMTAVVSVWKWRKLRASLHYRLI